MGRKVAIGSGRAAIDAVDKPLKTAFKNLYGDKNK